MKDNKDILVHICCGPCAIIPIKYLTSNYNVKCYFYNPNIHPYKEFKNRLEAAKSVIKTFNIEAFFDEGYYLNDFLEEISQTKDNRCATCYRLRLENTARLAKKIGAQAFTSSLLISPYQNREDILKVAHEVSKSWAIPFLAADFRPASLDSKKLSRELGLYMQGYCGCIFSEEERYYKRNEGITTTKASLLVGRNNK